jgi:hypothetical protein
LPGHACEGIEPHPGSVRARQELGETAGWEAKNKAVNSHQKAFIFYKFSVQLF